MLTPAVSISAPGRHKVITTVIHDGQQVWQTIHALSDIGPFTLCDQRVNEATDQPYDGEGITCPYCVARIRVAEERFAAAWKRVDEPMADLPELQADVMEAVEAILAETDDEGWAR